MSVCICLHVPVLILSVDSDWLIPFKVLQSLTGNRNYFYLRQSWSNFDQVRQSGVFAITVSQSKTIKVTWSNFDQDNFDSVNRLLALDCLLQIEQVNFATFMKHVKAKKIIWLNSKRPSHVEVLEQGNECAHFKGTRK